MTALGIFAYALTTFTALALIVAQPRKDAP
jgi:hypothetical protein